MRALPKEVLIVLHDNWGQTIRNEFGLWQGNKSLLTSCAAASQGTLPEADPVSMVIITKSWELLQKEVRGTDGRD